ncbi:hypothetical protein EV363DRAFT_1211624, partial [Boletus edulis]
MLIVTSLYAALTITITSTISSPKPVGLLVGFWGGTTGSTWMFLLLGCFSMDEHVICYCRVGLWVIYMFQILIGAIMVPEELRVVDDLHSISDIRSIIFLAVVLAILIILAFLGYVIDCSYVIATTRSGTAREDDTRFLAIKHPLRPQQECFLCKGLALREAEVIFKVGYFVDRQHQVQVQENQEMVHLLSDMDIV